MTKLHIFSDFDGTISEKDTLVFLATNLGGGPKMVEAIGRLLRSGELSLSEAIAAEMRSIRRPFADAEALLREQVRIDPGFVPFAAWCAAQTIPLTVLSAGFHQLIELFLPREHFSHLEVLANTLKPDEEKGWQCVFRDKSDWGHDKAIAIKAAKQRGEHTIFIGDGFSDRGAADVADEVFAKHSLIEHCRQNKIRFHEFHTFEDVLKQLQDKHSA